MALARVKTWNPGDTLLAVDLNGEFNNVLNNPLTLVSPTTGAINFNLQAHTNLLPSVITASSAVVGGVYLASTAATSVGSFSSVFSYRTSGPSLEATRFSTRLYGTVLTTNHITLSTGWGSTAGVSSIQGTDQNFRFTITAGSTVSANPTITTTFADGAFLDFPVVLSDLVTVGGGAATPATKQFISLTVNTSGVVFQPIFTPTTGATYIYDVIIR